MIQATARRMDRQRPQAAPLPQAGARTVYRTSRRPRASKDRRLDRNSRRLMALLPCTVVHSALLVNVIPSLLVRWAPPPLGLRSRVPATRPTPLPRMAEIGNHIAALVQIKYTPDSGDTIALFFNSV